MLPKAIQERYIRMCSGRPIQLVMSVSIRMCMFSCLVDPKDQNEATILKTPVRKRSCKFLSPATSQ